MKIPAVPLTSASIVEIQHTITREFLIALHLPASGWVSRLVAPILGLPAGKFARLAAEFDRRMASFGITNAMAWFLSHYVTSVEVQGVEHVPLNGPLILASNHPGAYDGVCIVAHCPRDDVDLVVSDVPFMHAFPVLSKHLIYVSSAEAQHWLTVREMVRRLQAGRALMIFPSGLVDPDPDLEPGASSALNTWSPSLELVIRRVPHTRLVPVMVSGVMAGSSLRNPLTRIPKTAWERRKLAEFLQVSQQLVFGRKYGLKPRLSFGEAFTVAEAGQVGLMSSIIAHAQKLLALHMTASNHYQT
jgi:hypothetical protein